MERLDELRAATHDVRKDLCKRGGCNAARDNTEAIRTTSRCASRSTGCAASAWCSTPSTRSSSRSSSRRRRRWRTSSSRPTLRTRRATRRRPRWPR